MAETTKPTDATFPIVDADCHVVEPVSLWSEFVPAEYRAAARAALFHDTNAAGDRLVVLNGAIVPDTEHSCIPTDAAWRPGTTVDEIGALDPDVAHEANPAAWDPHRGCATWTPRASSTASCTRRCSASSSRWWRIPTPPRCSRARTTTGCSTSRAPRPTGSLRSQCCRCRARCSHVASSSGSSSSDSGRSCCGRCSTPRRRHSSNALGGRRRAAVRSS